MPVSSTNKSSAKPQAVSGSAKPSCLGCPSNLSVTQQSSTFGRSIGGPVCAIKLIPLTRPTTKNDKNTFEHFAKNCLDRGREVTIEPSRDKAIEFTVSLPDPTAKESDNWEAEPVASCNGCANYVPERAVQKATGWRAPWCTAKGTLMFSDRLTQYAEGCTSRVFAPVHERLEDFGNSDGKFNVSLLAEYGEDFGKPQKLDIKKIHAINLSTRPQDYVSDATVTPRHEALGIRAFRRIQDPQGYGPNLVLPIMNESHIERDGTPLFSEEDKARIPRSGDPEKPEGYYDHNGSVYKTAVMWTRLKQTPAVWGIAGTGKTELFRHLAWMMGLPFQRISITESSELDDLFGKMLYSPERGTYFQYGRIPNAWARPNILCLDEPNTGPPPVWQRIRPLTDDSKQLILDENNNERINQHRICYLGMAMNPAWDPRNLGAMPLADADGSRLMHIEMGLPPEEVEKQILKEVLLDDKWDETEADHNISVIMRIAKELRELSDNGAIPVSWGIRNQKKVIRIRRYARWTDAFRMGVVDSLEPEVRDLILNVVRSHDDESD